MLALQDYRNIAETSYQRQSNKRPEKLFDRMKILRLEFILIARYQRGINRSMHQQRVLQK
ncbi:MAG: hypothetical protein CVV42_19935 [Candidatus Riflebacteria bacterium HGW-Riflebacteria-2]|nr:MAG: hypothetical protein CVV42_19935 [Candidatus Riflebacteria bacterium HGW-Riflebacteria-2]